MVETRFAWAAAYGFAVALAVLAPGEKAKAQVGEAPLPALTSLIQRAGPGVVTITLPSGAVGSGFVVAADRGMVILTARHLVAKAPLSVHLQDGTEWPATLVATHPDADVAVLRVDSKATLVPLPIGDSRRLQIGEWVVALGNPFGLGFTASAGIVGATGRSLGPSAPDVIQTDAAINPGNSGGPLLNLQGQVVAIATAAVGIGQGIGFAVPIHLAEPLLAGAPNGKP